MNKVENFTNDFEIPRLKGMIQNRINLLMKDKCVYYID